MQKAVQTLNDFMQNGVVEKRASNFGQKLF